MPPACPVESSRWQLTQPMPENLKMPPACPVEPHVGS